MYTFIFLLSFNFFDFYKIKTWKAWRNQKVLMVFFFFFPKKIHFLLYSGFDSFGLCLNSFWNGIFILECTQIVLTLLHKEVSIPRQIKWRQQIVVAMERRSSSCRNNFW